MPDELEAAGRAVAEAGRAGYGAVPGRSPARSPSASSASGLHVQGGAAHEVAHAASFDAEDDDRTDHDYIAETRTRGGAAHHDVEFGDTGEVKTFVNFVKSFVASGILGMPYAFAQAGVLVAIFMIIVLAAVSNYCIRLLLLCAEVVERETGKPASFHRIGKFAFDNYGVAMVKASLIFTQLGFCCVYVIFLGDNLVEVFEGTGSWFESLASWEWVLVLAPTLVLVCWLRSMRVLAYTSIIGQGAVSAGLAAILVIALFALVDDQPSVSGVRLKGFPIFFGMAVYTFEGIGLVLPMRRSMQRPENYHMILDTGFVVITLMVVSFGTVCYLGYGDSVQSQITLNLPAMWYSRVIQGMLLLAIWATYPVMMWPVTTLCEHWALRYRAPHWSHTWVRNGIRTGLVVLTIALALSIPQFDLFVSLVGAVGCSLLAFIMPVVFYMKIFRYTTRRWVMALNVAVVVFGVLASIVSVVVTSIQIVQAFFP